MSFAFAKLLPFKPKNGRMVAIDLGVRTTKAALLNVTDQGVQLLNYTLQSAPAHDRKPFTPQALAEQFKVLLSLLGADTDRIVVALGVEHAILRPLELPALPAVELRRLLKLNSKNYFQQELTGYVFECYVTRGRDTTIEGRPGGKTLDSGKTRVLVGAISETLLTDLKRAAADAELSLEQVVLGQLAPVNVLLALGTPTLEPIALVDIAYLNSTINILVDGQLRLTRVVEFGAHKFTSGLAEAMGISYPAAEGAILVLTEKVQHKLQSLLSPLGRELRASIDFFEHEQQRTVTRAYFSGGSARSDFIVSSLQHDLVIPCQKLEVTAAFELAMPEQQKAEISRDGPQLAVALGSGLAALNPNLVQINFLAEQQEAEKLRRRDPVKRGTMAAIIILCLVLLWAGFLAAKLWRTNVEVAGLHDGLTSIEKKTAEVISNAKQAGEIERMLATLHRMATNRFLWANPLNALQYAMVDQIQVVRLSLQQQTVTFPATAPYTNTSHRVVPGRPARTSDIITLTIQGKNFGDAATREKFIESIARHPYFRQHLRKADPVLLKELSPPQMDPTDPNRTFVLFTIECYYPERESRDD